MTNQPGNIINKLFNRFKYRAALSQRHTKRFLIPHEGNNHKPHALRPTALKIYSFSIIAVKLFVTGFLFLNYPSIGEFAAITQSEILNYTNASRAEAGLAPLKANNTLNQAATLKAQDMIADNYFAHTAPDGTKPWAFLKIAGYNYSAAGENLAMDFTEAGTVHTAFMNSPSHKKNIMNAAYTEMGVAVLDGELQGHQTTVLVEFFGTPYEETVAVAEPAEQPNQPQKTQPTNTAPANTNTNKTPAANTNTNKQTPVKTAAVPQYYRAQLTDQSAKELGIKTLEKISYWVEFKNTGTVTWINSGQYFVALNVTNPTGRDSQFKDDSWKEFYRPAVLKQASVKPGETGRFEFTLKAPEQTGNYEESFGLVAEDKGWIDGGTITIPIVVVAPPEKSTDMQVQVIPIPATAEPTNTNTTTNANINTNANVNVNVNVNAGVEEQPLAADQAAANPEQLVKSAGVIAGAEKNGENDQGFVGNIIAFSQRFYLVIIIFLVIVLLINILVEIKIQHPHLIAQTLLVIVLTSAALLTHAHFLERVPQVLKIT